MTKGFLLLLLIALSGYASGQQAWDYRKMKEDSLRKSGIDTIVSYSPWIAPVLQVNEVKDSCQVNDRGYLLWKKEQKLFIIEYYEYYNFHTNTKGISSEERALPDSLNLFGYLAAHFQQVVTDTLLPARLRKVKDDNGIVQTIYNRDVRDDVYTGISILAGDKTYSNSYSGTYAINEFTRQKAGGPGPAEKWENINYPANANKAIYQFITRIEKQVAVLFGWKDNIYSPVSAGK